MAAAGAALEFKSRRDDAWYDARLIAERTSTSGLLRLRVNFADFPDDQDEFLNLADVTTLSDLDSLLSRFRRLSLQLQDSECSSVAKGLLVCAARSLRPDDRRFFDAFIDGVVRKEHKVVSGVEECKCSFILEWIHGPQAGTLTAVELPAICRVRLPAVDEEIDPALTEFVNAAKDKIERTFSNSIGSSGVTESSSSRRKRRKGTSPQVNKNTSRARRSLTPNSSSKVDIVDNSAARDEHDMDIGGLPHIMFIENLEKGISSFTVTEFIHKQLSISCQALVFPSKSSDAYTSGTIRLNSKRDFNKLSEFLGSPDRIIISARGRPWVLTEKIMLDDTIRSSVETLKLTSQTALEIKTQKSDALKVVMSGSQEYTIAKQLRDLFKEFTNHQCGLHQRLLQEEGKISQLAM